MPTTIIAFIQCTLIHYSILCIFTEVQVVEGTDIDENNYFLNGSFYPQCVVEFLA